MNSSANDAKAIKNKLFFAFRLGWPYLGDASMIADLSRCLYNTLLFKAPPCVISPPFHPPPLLPPCLEMLEKTTAQDGHHRRSCRPAKTNDSGKHSDDETKRGRLRGAGPG